jgi:hypothetical protein
MNDNGNMVEDRSRQGDLQPQSDPNAQHVSSQQPSFKKPAKFPLWIVGATAGIVLAIGIPMVWLESIGGVC